MLHHQPLDLVQVAAIEAVVARELHGIEPKLSFISTGFNMDMGRLLPLVAEKKKRKRPLRSTVGIGELVRGKPRERNAF
jgi:hypothetical protein